MTFARQRAEQAARQAEFRQRWPTKIDRWIWLMQMAFASPANIYWEKDEERVKELVAAARQIGLIYYEEGGEALRVALRALSTSDPGYSGERFTEEQVETVVSWCRIVWSKGSAHPLAFWHHNSWVWYEYGELTEEQRSTFTERARRMPYAYDVLAEEAGTAASSAALSPLQRTFEPWLARLQRAWADPTSIPDEEQARGDLKAARKLGIIYYEEGSAALRVHLHEVGYEAGRLSVGQVEEVLAWCRRTWAAGSCHPSTPQEPSTWTEFQFGELAGRLRPALEQHVLDFPAPADLLAEAEAEDTNEAA